MKELYPATVNRPRDKWDWCTDQFGPGLATISTTSHNVHRVRRAAINPFFSKSSVRSLEPLIEGKIHILLEKLAQFKTSQNIFTFSIAMAAMTSGMLEVPE